jgi:two-component system, response regulator
MTGAPLTGTILLVDDNPDDTDLTIRALQKNQIANDVVVARDGVEALEYLHGTADRPPLYPQVVLLDLNLPRLGGFEVLRRLRADERTRMQPVIVLTSSKQEQDVLQSYQLGANSYVRKPVDFVQFTEAIHALGLYWLLFNIGPPASVSGR